MLSDDLPPRELRGRYLVYRRKANGRNGFAENGCFSFKRIEMGIAYIVMGAKADAWNGKAVSAVVCPGGQNGIGNDGSCRTEVRRNDKGKGQSKRIDAAYLTAESGCLFLLVERRGRHEKYKM